MWLAIYYFLFLEKVQHSNRRDLGNRFAEDYVNSREELCKLAEQPHRGSRARGSSVCKVCRSVLKDYTLTEETSHTEESTRNMASKCPKCDKTVYFGKSTCFLLRLLQNVLYCYLIYVAIFYIDAVCIFSGLVY